MTLKLCVFPNDPLKAYFEKGEIKNRYYNPKNFFDEIHFISLVEKDIEVEKIQTVAGTAKIFIHSVGKINIKNRKKYVKNIIELCQKINPDVIRAFNPFVEGWLAANCANALNKPFLVSLHTQYDFNRKLVKKNLKKFLALKYSERVIEPYTLNSADKIFAVYKIIEPYVVKHTSKRPEILHNKVDCEKFFNCLPIDTLPQPLILSVGRLISVKNHKLLIEAMKTVNGHLLIIGNGELYSELIGLIKKYKVENKVTIKKSVPYEEIQNYYKSAKVFALAYNTEVESLPMPVMEAMATGIPVVLPYPKKGFTEGLEGTAVFSDMNAKSFSINMQKILEDKILMEKFSKRSLIKSQEFDINKIEQRESEIYAELVNSRNHNDL